jgi:deazaflavin-dependent oxidoreductase (nitroreductase family)
MWYNPFMIRLLRSPFHALISKNILLLTVTGRKSGREISTPVNYLRDGKILWVASDRGRNWWRNLVDGAPVTLLLEGKTIVAKGKAITDPEGVKTALGTYFKLAPGMARYFGVKLDKYGSPNPQDLSRAVIKQVMIQIALT